MPLVEGVEGEKSERVLSHKLIVGLAQELGNFTHVLKEGGIYTRVQFQSASSGRRQCRAYFDEL